MELLPAVRSYNGMLNSHRFARHSARFARFACSQVVVYPIGIPVGVLAMLLWNRDRLGGSIVYAFGISCSVLLPA